MPALKTSRLYSGTPAVETSLLGSETIAWMSEVPRRTAGSFASVASSVWKQNVDNRREEGRSEGTHLDHATNPIEIRPPGRDCLTVVLCMEGSGEHTPFAPLDDMPLDLNHGPAIVILVNNSTGVWVASPTHVVSFSRMDGPGRGAPPVILRSRDWQISAQVSPSSTKSTSSIAESCVHQPTIDEHGQSRNELLLWRGDHWQNRRHPLPASGLPCLSRDPGR